MVEKVSEEEIGKFYHKAVEMYFKIMAKKVKLPEPKKGAVMFVRNNKKREF